MDEEDMGSEKEEEDRTPWLSSVFGVKIDGKDEKTLGKGNRGVESQRLEHSDQRDSRRYGKSHRCTTGTSQPLRYISQLTLARG